jgi:F0F1-type ATP synthase assembly protein I
VQHRFDPDTGFTLKSLGLSTRRPFRGLYLPGRGAPNHVFSALKKVVLAQAALALLCALVAGLFWGGGSALAAVAGGAVVVASTLAYGGAYFWRSPRDQGNPGRALRTVLFAEAVKWMIAIGGLLWLLQTPGLAGEAGPAVTGFVVALIGSWLALLTKT